MSRIENIINHPSTGMLPYLNSKLEGNYSRFLIRPFAFGSTDLKSGFRLRDYASTVEGDRVSARVGVLVGKVITLTDSVISPIRGAELARDIDAAIHHWSKCICPSLSAPVAQFTGAIAPTQDRNITSENPNGWWIAVIRSFEIEFVE